MEREVLRFYGLALQAIRSHAMASTAMILCCIIVALANSVFFPEYASEALVLIPANEDVESLQATPLDIKTNERFLSTQLTALLSDAVLAPALAATGVEPDGRRTRALRERLELERLPFNNTVTMRALGRDPQELRPLLGAIIESYEQWIRASFGREASRMRESLKQQLRAEPSASEPTSEEDRRNTASEEGSMSRPRNELQARLQEVELFVQRTGSISVEVLNRPSPPMQRNNLARNLTRALLLAAFTLLLLGYVQALKQVATTESSNR